MGMCTDLAIDRPESVGMASEKVDSAKRDIPRGELVRVAQISPHVVQRLVFNHIEAITVVPVRFPIVGHDEFIDILMTRET